MAGGNTKNSDTSSGSKTMITASTVTSMSQLAAPSPVSPPYSQHSPLIQHLQQQQNLISHHPSLAGRAISGSLPGSKRAHSDCNDNLTSSSDLPSYGHPAKKSKKSGEDHPPLHYSNHHLDGMKSSIDGNSSCRSTPLTPLSSKSGGSQDGSSSPNSPPFHQNSFRNASVVPIGGPNDASYAASYYQQPYYHPLYSNHQHHGYYSHHQGWTAADFNLHHASTATSAAATTLPVHPPPSATTTATSALPANYQHSYPLTPDGSCNNAGADVAMSYHHDKVKDDDAQQQQTSTYSSSTMAHSEDGGLIPSAQGINETTTAAVVNREALEYPTSYKGDCSENHMPSYYTK